MQPTSGLAQSFWLLHQEAVAPWLRDENTPRGSRTRTTEIQEIQNVFFGFIFLLINRLRTVDMHVISISRSFHILGIT